MPARTGPPDGDGSPAPTPVPPGPGRTADVQPDGAPQHLGPYQVTGRWHAEDGGQVLAGLGPDGEAELVVLGAGPMLDAAARDRFAAAIEHAAEARPGSVLAADPHGQVPWAALRPGSGPAGARPLLDAPLTAAVAPGDHRGPDFRPYWAGLAATYPTPHQAAGPPEADRGRRWWPLAVATAVVLLLLLAACWPRPDLADGGSGTSPSPTSLSPSPVPPPDPTPTPTPTPTPSPSGGAPSDTASDAPGAQAGPAPSASGTPGALPVPSQPLQEGPGVSGPSFATGAATREMRLAGVPFPFRVPAGWECRESPLATGDAVRYVCFDSTWTGSGTPPGGIVEVQDCGPPCDTLSWDALRLTLTDDVGWRQVDVGTLAAEDEVADEQGGGPLRSRLRMSHVFSAGRDGTVDTHVYVEMTAPPAAYGDVQAVANDIRANSP